MNFAHGFALELQLRRVMEQTVENGVGERRFADGLVPMSGWELAGDECCAAPVAILDHFEQVIALLLGQYVQAPIINDEQLGFCQLGKEFAEATVAMRHRKHFK